MKIGNTGYSFDGKRFCVFLVLCAVAYGLDRPANRVALRVNVPDEAVFVYCLLHYLTLAIRPRTYCLVSAGIASIQRGPCLAMALSTAPGPALYPSDEEISAKLRGKNLACFCPLDQPCHADVLLELANQELHP